MKGLFIAATLFCGVLALLTGRAEALGAEMMAAGDAAVELGLIDGYCLGDLTARQARAWLDETAETINGRSAR